MVREPSMAIGFDHPSRGEGLQAGTCRQRCSTYYMYQQLYMLHVRCAVSFIQG